MPRADWECYSFGVEPNQHISVLFWYWRLPPLRWLNLKFQRKKKKVKVLKYYSGEPLATIYIYFSFYYV